MQQDHAVSPKLIKRPVLTNTLSAFGATVILMVLNVLNGALTGRMLGPEGKGVLVLVGLVINQVSYIFSLSAETSIVYFAGRRGYSITRLARAAMGLAVLVGLPAMVTALLLLYWMGRDFPEGVRWLAYGGVLMIVPYIATIYLQYLFRSAGRISENALLNVFNQLISLIAFVLVLLGGLDLAGALSAYYFAILVAFLVYLGLSLRWQLFDGRIMFFETTQKDLVSYGLKGHFGSLLQLLNYRIDLYIIALLLPSAQVGLYSVSIVAAELIWLIPNVLAPIIMQEAATRDDQALKTFMGFVNRSTAGLLIIFSLVWIPLGGFFIQLVYGEQFAAAYTPFLLLIPGTWALGMWKNLINHLSARGYPFYKTASTGVSTVILLLLLLLLVEPFGIEGAAIASTVAYFCALLAVIRPYSRVIGLRLIDILIPHREDLVLLHVYARKGLRVAVDAHAAAEQKERSHEPD